MTAETAASSQEFENEKIQLTITEEPNCVTKFSITVKESENKRVYKQAIKDINKEVSLPGFRKGKAPEAIIQKNYGPHVEKRWKELLAQHSLQQGMAISKVYPLNTQAVSNPQFQELNPQSQVKIDIEFEKEPSVPALDYESLQVKRIETQEVTQEDIDDSFKEVQLMHAKWEEVKDRPVQEGDFVDLDIETTEEPKKMLCSEKRFEVAPKKIGKWLQKLILGKQVGDKVEGESELEEDADEETAQNFQATKCLVTIKAIKNSVLPELNEDFFKKVGTSSQEDMLEKIKQRLEHMAVSNAKEKQIRAIQDALVEKYDFPLPFSMMEEERRARIKERIQNLKKENTPDDMILGQEKAIEKEVSQEVTRSLKLWFITKAISQTENISVSDPEINQEIATQLGFLNFQQNLNTQDLMNNSNLRSKIYVDLLMHKAANSVCQKLFPEKY